jgi:hypothetical protein
MNGKMRKLTVLVLAIFTLTILMAGCGGGSKNETAPHEAFGSGAAMKNGMAVAPSMADSAYSGGAYYDGDYYMGDYDYPTEAEAYDAVMSGGSDVGNARADAFDKIIYSGSASVETIRFEETIDKVYALIEEYGGFVESSYVTGKDYNTTYYNRPGYRSASFTIRVPRESFQSFTGALESLGNLTRSSVQAQNITSSYFDTQSRLNTYRTEESRLLDMLAKADTVEDMLSIEDRLANVRYNIESLTTTLNNWDSKINYSTLELSISEVKELTQETPITRTFGQDIAERFRSSCQWLLQAVKNGFLFFISAIPVLILPVVIVVIILLIIRAKRHNKRRKNDVESAR